MRDRLAIDDNPGERQGQDGGGDRDRCGSLQVTRDELGLRKRPRAPSGAAVFADSSHIICFGAPLRSGRVDAYADAS